jgi:hypothetical protein
MTRGQDDWWPLELGLHAGMASKQRQVIPTMLFRIKHMRLVDFAHIEAYQDGLAHLSICASPLVTMLLLEFPMLAT